MTLRRLNIKIQGYPESYATEPYMEQTLVVGDPALNAMAVGGPPAMPPEMATHVHPSESLTVGSNVSAPAEPVVSESRDTGIGEGSLNEAEDAPPTE